MRAFIIGAIALAAAGAQPPRDTRPPGAAAGAVASAHASISGVVVADDTGASPVRGGLVTITGEDGTNPGHTVVTDDDGRFVCGGLAAGRYSLTATKSPYLTTAFGAKRPGAPGARLSLASGQAVADITIRMPHGAAITGVVTDESGAPMPDVSVAAVSLAAAPADAQSPAASTQFATDANGTYRIYGLAPGDYAVVATVAGSNGLGDIGARADGEVDAIFERLQRRVSGPAAATSGTPAPGTPSIPAVRTPLYGYAPVFFPGTSNAADIQPVHLVAGEEREAVSFAMKATPMGAIEGTVTGPPGAMTGLALALDPLDVDRFISTIFLSVGTMPTLVIRPGPDGHFRYTTVSPGRYTLIVRASSGFWAAQDVAVDGDDVTGLTLNLEPALRVTGRFQVDGRAPGDRFDVAKARVGLRAPGQTGTFSMNGTILGRPGPVGSTQPDGTFQFTGVVPGPYEWGAPLPETAGGWRLRSVIFNGQDLLDGPVAITGIDPNGIVVTVTNRHSLLSGSLTNAAGAPMSDYSVVAFPAERGYWHAGSRRVRLARPATDGSFSIRDLPAGNYLLAALAEVDPAKVDAPEFLDAIAAAGVPVTVTDGETTVQDIRLQSR